MHRINRIIKIKWIIIIIRHEQDLYNIYLTRKCPIRTNNIQLNVKTLQMYVFNWILIQLHWIVLLKHNWRIIISHTDFNWLECYIDMLLLLRGVDLAYVWLWVINHIVHSVRDEKWPKKWSDSMASKILEKVYQ